MNTFELFQFWPSLVLFGAFCSFSYTFLYLIVFVCRSWKPRDRLLTRQLAELRKSKKHSLTTEIERNVPLVSKPGTGRKKLFLETLINDEGVVWAHAVSVIFLLIFGLQFPESFLSVFLGLIALCVSWLGFWIKNSQRRRRMALFLDQLPEVIDIIVRGARVGNSIPKNLATIGSEMPAPIGPIFQDIAHRLNIGMSLETAFLAMPVVPRLKELHFLATTLALQKVTGGEYAEILENLSRVLRERRTFSLKTKALTSEGRLSAKVVSGMTVAVIGLLAITNKAQLEFLLYDPSGRNLLLYCVLSTCIGLFCVSCIVRASK